MRGPVTRERDLGGVQSQEGCFTGELKTPILMYLYHMTTPGVKLRMENQCKLL
jgi:hypothetical protein